jgi:uncharacterized protein (DUF2141 family)
MQNSVLWYFFYPRIFMTKPFSISAVCLGVFGSFFWAAQAQASSSNLDVEIDGLRNQRGQVCLSLFASSQGFPGESANAVDKQCVKITNTPLEVKFQNLRPGNYAVVVLHDINGDNKANRNLFGIPKEGFGFSRNPTIRFSAPKFSETAFTVAGPSTKIQIQLKYLLGG